MVGLNALQLGAEGIEFFNNFHGFFTPLLNEEYGIHTLCECGENPSVFVLYGLKMFLNQKSRFTPAVRMGLSISVATGLYGISFQISPWRWLPA